MKKLLALLLVICSVFSLASCSLLGPKPPKDLEDVADELEDSKKYTAYWTDDEDDIGNPAIKEKLRIYGIDEDGYRDYDDYLEVTVFDTRRAAKLYYKELKTDHQYEIDECKNYIAQLKYLINHYEDDFDSDELDDLEDELKDAKKELEELQKEIVLGISGKRVWYGSKDTLKDIK